MATIGLIAPHTPLEAPTQEVVAEVVYVPDFTTKEGIEAYICSKDWDCKVALAIITAESRHVSWAYNPEWHRGCQGSFGLFQVACLHFKIGEDKLDIKTNIDKAYSIWEKQGFYPWTTFTSGKYKKFLL